MREIAERFAGERAMSGEHLEENYADGKEIGAGIDLQAKMPEIYSQAGMRGNMVIAAPQPTIVISPRALAPANK